MTRPNGLIEYLIFIEKRSSTTEIIIIKEKHIIPLYNEVQEICFKKEISKWSLNNCAEFVNDVNMKPTNFIKFLEHLFSLYFNDTSNRKGNKSAKKFIKTLLGSKKFLSINTQPNASPKILREDLDAFLTEMKSINRLVNTSHDSMVDFIHENFTTGLQKSTLRRLYFD